MTYNDGDRVTITPGAYPEEWVGPGTVIKTWNSGQISVLSDRVGRRGTFDPDNVFPVGYVQPDLSLISTSRLLAEIARRIDNGA